MKTVRIVNGTVREIIPDYALPISKWYGEAFAAQCVEAPDEVEQRWEYGPDTGVFSEPTVKPHEYTDIELAQQAITDLELAAIEEGQTITELELTILSKE